jgi:hypothetical protein
MDAQCDVVELMRGVPALASADAGVLRELEALARVVTLPPGPVLFIEGDQHTALFLV